mmetsp:Transcript_11630/g.40714  ORF Transcript_11630/g.40714 Transcript_11630/m.40714 type:complete len:233 (-) Transcript_11630:1760-2458(-)
MSSYTGCTCAAGVNGSRPVWKMYLTKRTSLRSTEKPICCMYGFAYAGPCASNHSTTSSTVSPARAAGSGHVRSFSVSSHSFSGRARQAVVSASTVADSVASASSHTSSMCCCAARSEMSHASSHTTSPRSPASVGSRSSLLMPATPNTSSKSKVAGITEPPLPSLMARDGCSNSSRSSMERQNGWSSGRNCAGSLDVSTLSAATPQTMANTRKTPTMGLAYVSTKRACGPPK